MTSNSFILIRPRRMRRRPAEAKNRLPARHHALWLALVQASLDPAVRSIWHVATASVGNDLVEVDAVVLARDDGRFVLDVVPARPPLKFDEAVLRGVALRGLGLAALTVLEHRHWKRREQQHLTVMLRGFYQYFARRLSWIRHETQRQWKQALQPVANAVG